MDVIFGYVAVTGSDTVTFSYVAMKQESSESLLQSQIPKILFNTNSIIYPVIHSSHWFSIIAYLKEKNVICLDSFYKTKKVDMFERVIFYYQWKFEKLIAKSGHHCQ